MILLKGEQLILDFLRNLLIFYSSNYNFITTIPLFSQDNKAYNNSCKISLFYLIPIIWHNLMNQTRQFSFKGELLFFLNFIAIKLTVGHVTVS